MVFRVIKYVSYIGFEGKKIIYVSKLILKDRFLYVIRTCNST